MNGNREFYNEFRAIIDRYDRYEANMVKFVPKLIEGSRDIILLFYPEKYDKIKWESQAFVDFAEDSFSGVDIILNHYLYGYEKSDVLVEWTTEIKAWVPCEEWHSKWLSLAKTTECWMNILKLIRESYFEAVYYGCYQMHFFRLFKKLIVDFYPELIDLSSEGFRELNTFLAYQAHILQKQIYTDFVDYRF
nr:hypothetical protein [uncultured Carboxylicivirga sp.]